MSGKRPGKRNGNGRRIPFPANVGKNHAPQRRQNQPNPSSSASPSQSQPPSTQGPIFMSPTAQLAQCSICLSTITNRAVLDPCHHDYCFACIKQWMEMNNHCPICRENTVQILHNIRSETEYESIPVEQRTHFDSDVVMLPFIGEGLIFAHLIMPGYFILTPNSSLTLLTQQHEIGQQLDANTLYYFPRLEFGQMIQHEGHEHPLAPYLSTLDLLRIQNMQLMFLNILREAQGNH